MQLPASKPASARREAAAVSSSEPRVSGFIPPPSRSGFTLLELLLAVSLLAVVMMVTYMGFSTVAQAWQRGTDMADKLHHGDFVVEQIVMALRSAYYPATGVNPDYGMWFTDDGEGPGSVDEASWVALGASLVGRNVSHAGGPHRVILDVEDTARGKAALAVRSWGILSQIEDFDYKKLKPTYIAAPITGINYRFQDPESVENQAGAAGEVGAGTGAAATKAGSDEIEWIDEWEDTNRIPRMVELTVYMEPLVDDDKPVEVKRVVELPLAPLAWK